MDSRYMIRTMCPMNCHPTLCGMLVEMQAGQPVKVSGDKENPDSRGFLCVRGRTCVEVIGNPKRILTPLIRDRRGEDSWRQAGWDETLDLITGRMKTVGREAVGIWAGHGILSTNYGTRIGAQLLRRFSNFYGCQHWNPVMICWGLGAFGLSLTGVLETSTQKDMAQNTELLLLWGANLSSQPTTAPHITAARRRGARIITIDVRHTEAAARSHEVYQLRPGTDTALALGLMHVIIAEESYDREFVAHHTVGFEELAEHVKGYPPHRAAAITGIPERRIIGLARRYARTRPAMILLGSSSMHKGVNTWQAARAVACLPALTGNLGVPGGGMGPRHGSTSHDQGLGDITAEEVRPPGAYIPNQMSRITASLGHDQVKVLFLFGTNMLSSFPDAGQLAAGLRRADLVVTYDLFLNDTARRYADVILPASFWLEEIGCKMTHTHVYLMEKGLDPPGQAHPLGWVLAALAQRLGLSGFYPWGSEEEIVDAILDHPCTGHATVNSLRAQGGIRALRISRVSYPGRQFPTPSGKVEFYSARALDLGLPPLPVYEEQPAPAYPLALCHGRTLTHFHSFYDHGRALPSLAPVDPEPRLWLAPPDAAARGIKDGDRIRIYNEQGDFQAHARVTEKIPAGAVWIRDGWEGLNRLTSCRPVLPDQAVDIFGFSAGQASFQAMVEVAPVSPSQAVAQMPSHP